MFSGFHPLVSRWFHDALGQPTAAQQRGWEAIRQGRHTLIAAPTGSGKTLAAFLIAIDELVREGMDQPLPDEVRVLYVSPLKALSADIHKNLAEPRRGVREVAETLGVEAPHITAAVRTGDTTAAERAAILRKPPHILVTTPESLYLLLTSARSRHVLRTVRTVIVDEIHAVIGGRRGAHLALSLERLEFLVRAHCNTVAADLRGGLASEPLQRIGLSATQKPIEDVARFLVGHRAADCAIVDEGHRREMDLAVEIPRSPLDAVMSHEVWEEYYDRLTQLVGEHRTTLIFVNTRKMAERTSRHLSERLGEDAVTAHHGSLSKETRLDAEHRLKAGTLKALVATASLELGIDIGHVDLVCQIGSPHRIATLLQRVGRSGHTISGTPKGRLLPTSRDDLVECAALLRAVRRGDLDRIVSMDAPLDVLAQQIAAEAASQEWTEDELFALVRRAWPYRSLARSDFDAVVRMLAEGFSTRRGRRAALVHRDEVHSVLKGRRGTRMLALTSGGAIPEIADYRVVLEPEDTFVGTLNEDFAIESNAGDIFQLGNASWQITQVVAGTVRVRDAHGAPPTIPFWLGEAPARSDELSRAVSDLRADFDQIAGAGVNDPEVLAAAGSNLAGAIVGAGSSRPVGIVGAGFSRPADWLAAETGLCAGGAEQAAAYLLDGRAALGVIPTQETLVLERFFDEAGGMQLVLHAPFGSRINKAWTLALRKRFCRQFNFELQAAATEDALLLSLGPQHSFPLSDVFRYLHPATTRDILVQALLDAPLFKTRWRWNTTISLAVPRSRSGTKVPPQLQRMQSDDLMAAVFPDAAACLENIPGDREIPDHPLVNQTVRDCLDEAMDFNGLIAVLSRIHAGELRCVARDTPEPSAFAHEILNAKPYAFMDDAPLEERRTQAVQTRVPSDRAGSDMRVLDADAIGRVRDEQRPDPRDADELHDALLTAGFLLPEEISIPTTELSGTGRATQATIDLASDPGSRIPDPGTIWISAERLPELLAIHAVAALDPVIAPPVSRTAHTWTREAAIVELLRGRLCIVGPTTAAMLAESLRITEADADAALLTLEAEGAVLRGRFTGDPGRDPGSGIRDAEDACNSDRGPGMQDPRSACNSDRGPGMQDPRSACNSDRGPGMQDPRSACNSDRGPGMQDPKSAYESDRGRGVQDPKGTCNSDPGSRIPDPGRSPLEWCDRRLLARIHRYTLNRLRAEIAPVSPADFMRFLFVWQHVDAASRLVGMDGLREVIAQLDGIEASARAWERDLLPARIAEYDPSMLDMLCLTGSVGWARLSSAPTQVVTATPIALFLREHADTWMLLTREAREAASQSSTARHAGVVAFLRANGASFANAIADACDLRDDELRRTIADLVAEGVVSSDGFAGLRAIIAAPGGTHGRLHRVDAAGRWFLVDAEGAGRDAGSGIRDPKDTESRTAAVETLAWTLLRRYGVIFRRLLTRESFDVPWRELVRVYRRLEARGDIRGGRFVNGMSGEQFALPEAVERLREVRRSPASNALITISGADPLNLTGIVTGTERIRISASTRIVYRNGIAIAAMEGDMLRALADVEANVAADAAAAAAGRRVPVIAGYVGRV